MWVIGLINKEGGKSYFNETRDVLCAKRFATQYHSKKIAHSKTLLLVKFMKGAGGWGKGSKYEKAVVEKVAS